MRLVVDCEGGDDGVADVEAVDFLGVWIVAETITDSDNLIADDSDDAAGVTLTEAFVNGGL